MSERNLKLNKKLPISHRNEFWTSLMDSVEDEVLLMMDEIEKKKTFLSYRESDLDTLLNLASVFIILPKEYFENIKEVLNESYGLSDEVIEFYLRKELYKLPFNFKEKATYNFYKSIFNVFGFSFSKQISVYRYLPGYEIIIRDIEPFLNGVTSSIISYYFSDGEDEFLEDDFAYLGFSGIRPVRHIQESTNNFLGYYDEADTLDNGSFVEDPSGDYRYSDELGIYVYDPDAGTHSWDGSTFDEIPPIKLNTLTETTITSTRHIGLEIELDRVIIKNFLPVAISYEAFQYIFSSTYFYKRQVEVPHVGAQLSFIMDKSGYWDTHSDEVITSNIVPISDFSRDYIWQKGDGWKIIDNHAIYEDYVLPIPSSPENLSLLQTPLVLPGMSQEDVLNSNLGTIESGTQVRIIVSITSLTPPSPMIPGLTEYGGIFTVDSSYSYKRDLIKFTEAGEFSLDIIWGEDELSYLNIWTIVPISINKVEIIPFDRFSVPEVRGRCAMKQGISEENLLSIDYFKFGYGSNKLPSILDDVYSFPDDVESYLATIEPLPQEDSTTFSNELYMGAIAEYKGQLINGYTIGAYPVGGSTSFSGNIFPDPIEYMPFRYRTVILGIVDLSDFSATPIYIYDDGRGRLIDPDAGDAGTIDYSTGDITFETTETYNYPIGVKLYEVYIENPTRVSEVAIWGRTLDNPTTPQILAYATFAPVELPSNSFHFNMGVVLEK